MSAHSTIEWTDATWNPVVGCTKVSQGCKHCYAKTVHDRRHKAHVAGKSVAAQYAKPFEAVQLKPERLTTPLRWRQPRRIFVNSVSDLFHDDVPDEFIAEVWAVMALARRHTFQVLTKRAARMRDLLTNTDFAVSSIKALRALARTRGVVADGEEAIAWPLPNVWLGVSVENQSAAQERIPLLLDTPSAVRFLSCEPLLEAIDLRRVYRDVMDAAHGIPCIGNGELHWVIGGGESGSSKQTPRAMHPEWILSLRDQCVTHGVPFLFKQWGDWVTEDQAPQGIVLPGESFDFYSGQGPSFYRVGKKRAGRELDGRTWDEMPSAEVSTYRSGPITLVHISWLTSKDLANAAWEHQPTTRELLDRAIKMPEECATETIKI